MEKQEENNAIDDDMKKSSFEKFLTKILLLSLFVGVGFFVLTCYLIYLGIKLLLSLF